jgi:hypothetical protein
MANKVTGYSNGAQVRDWAQKNDFPAGGARGRLPGETIAAFNEAHPQTPYKVAERTSEATVKVTGSREITTNGKTRKVPFSATVSKSDARKWGQDNGYTVGDRGRLPQEVLQAFGLHTAEMNAAARKSSKSKAAA